MAAPRPRVTAAICAYNEAANIGALVRTLLGRDRDAFDELLVVSSGSTDGTDEAARQAAGSDPAFRLVVEPARAGKAAAVNRVLAEAAGDVILLLDADILPAPGALVSMTRHFGDPSVGGVGAHNVPVNAAESAVARAGAVLWRLHHLVSLRHPVLGGDVIAFRRAIAPLPPGTVNDDHGIEVALRRAGLAVLYEPDAVVRMRVPATARDFVRQRRRVYAGYRAAPGGGGKATLRPGLVLAASAGLLRSRPGDVPWLLLLTLLEAWSRVAVLVEALRARSRYYTAWEPVASTKGALAQGEDRERAP